MGRRALVLFAAASLAACSRVPVDGRDRPDAGSDAAACGERSAAAGDEVQLAVVRAQQNVGCLVDDDCVLASNSSACWLGCGVLLNRAGEAAVQAAIDRVNASTCAAFADAGCVAVAPPCAPPLGGAACVAGECRDFPPAAWVSFAIVDQPAGGSVSSPPSCDGSIGACTQWTVTPDGGVVVHGGASPGARVLAPDDLAAVDAVLRSVPFRQSTVNGFGCAPKASSAVIALSVTRAHETRGFDVTGCVQSGPAGNDAKRLYDVVTRY